MCHGECEQTMESGLQRQGGQGVVKRVVLVLVTALSGFLAMSVAADHVCAQKRASLDEGPIVRRKLLYRSSRFEVAPRLGSTLNDAYKRNMLVGLDANFHLTNEFGLGVSGYFSPLHPNTDLLDQIEGTLSASEQADISYAVVTALFDVHASFVPFFGKFSVFRNIINYDIHLVGGLGGALISAEGAAAGEAKFTGINPGMMFGGGGRLFISDNIAVVMDVKDYIYSTADSQTGQTRPKLELRSNVMMSLGVSFFFPGEVPISR